MSDLTAWADAVGRSMARADSHLLEKQAAFESVGRMRARSAFEKTAAIEKLAETVFVPIFDEGIGAFNDFIDSERPSMTPVELLKVGSMFGRRGEFAKTASDHGLREASKLAHQVVEVAYYDDYDLVTDYDEIEKTAFAGAGLLAKGVGGLLRMGRGARAAGSAGTSAVGRGARAVGSAAAAPFKATGRAAGSLRRGVKETFNRQRAGIKGFISARKGTAPKVTRTPAVTSAGGSASGINPFGTATTGAKPQMGLLQRVQHSLRGAQGNVARRENIVRRRALGRGGRVAERQRELGRASEVSRQYRAGEAAKGVTMSPTRGVNAPSPRGPRAGSPEASQLRAVGKPTPAAPAAAPKGPASGSPEAAQLKSVPAKAPAPKATAPVDKAPAAAAEARTPFQAAQQGLKDFAGKELYRTQGGTVFTGRHALGAGGIGLASLGYMAMKKPTAGY